MFSSFPAAPAFTTFDTPYMAYRSPPSDGSSGKHNPASVLFPHTGTQPAPTATPMNYSSVPAYTVFDFLGVTPPKVSASGAPLNPVGWPVLGAPAPAPAPAAASMSPWNDIMLCSQIAALYDTFSTNQQAEYASIVGGAATVSEIGARCPYVAGYPFAQPTPLTMPAARDNFMPEPLPTPMLGSQLLQQTQAAHQARQVAQQVRQPAYQALPQEMQLRPEWVFNVAAADEQEQAGEAMEEQVQLLGEERDEQRAETVPTRWQARDQQSSAYLDHSPNCSDLESELGALVSDRSSDEDEQPTDESAFLETFERERAMHDQFFDRYATAEEVDRARIGVSASAPVSAFGTAYAVENASASVSAAGGAKRRSTMHAVHTAPVRFAAPSAAEADGFRNFQARSTFELSPQAIDDLVTSSMRNEQEMARMRGWKAE